ncbi:ABC transporter substrate-binding protein [Cupriavidus basilensis]
MNVKRASLLAIAAAALAVGTASAQVKVGVTVSATGPAASLGIPEKNTFTLMPKEIAGKKVEYIILDDASDTTTAAKQHAQADQRRQGRCGGGLHRHAELAGHGRYRGRERDADDHDGRLGPHHRAGGRQARLVSSRHRRTTSHMATAIAEHMGNNGVKTVAFIGFADAYGDSWAQEFAKVADMRKIKVVANERFARTDTSVTGQVLKMLGSNPDAVLIAGSGTPAALPAKTLKERGYKGKIYQDPMAWPTPISLRVCGKDCEGTFLPAGPLLVADQLPDSNPVKKPAMTYKTAYEKAFGGQVSTFGGHAGCRPDPAARRSRSAEKGPAPAPRSSARHCATPWSRPGTCRCRTAS